MHLKRVNLHPEAYPTLDHYPFNLDIFHQTKSLEFPVPVTFFVGENGTGKTTLLKALVQKCGIHIWGQIERRRFEINPYEEELYRAMDVEWTDGRVPGSFFASEIFRNFTRSLDEWAAATPGILDYFGGSPTANLSCPFSRLGTRSKGYTSWTSRKPRSHQKAN